MDILKKKLDSAGKRISLTRTKNGGTMFKRCTRELGRIGIIVDTKSFKAEAIIFDMGKVPVKERAKACTIVTNLMSRAKRPVTHSDHQLTWFDLKQAAGLIHLAKNGDKEAVTILKWANGTMDAVRAKLGEELKAKAKKPAKSAGDRKSPPKSKPAKGGKKKKTASLAPSTMSE